MSADNYIQNIRTAISNLQKQPYSQGEINRGEALLKSVEELPSFMNESLQRSPVLCSDIPYFMSEISKVNDKSTQTTDYLENLRDKIALLEKYQTVLTMFLTVAYE